MNLPPRDYTKQENIIAECLDEFGLRYEQQYDFPPYTVDIYIPEINMVIEADGKYGHLQKSDSKRDVYITSTHNVKYVLHIKDTTKEKIKDILWQELNNLE